jgi:hypothetical protein
MRLQYLLTKYFGRVYNNYIDTAQVQNMKLRKFKRALFKLKRRLKSHKGEIAFDAAKEVREVARLGQRLVIMELK